jgi:hypothetical protein
MASTATSEFLPSNSSSTRLLTLRALPRMPILLTKIEGKGNGIKTGT